MNAKTIILSLAGLMLCAAAGIAWKGARATAEIQSALAEIAVNQAATEAALQRGAQTLAATENEQRLARPTLEALQSSNATAAAASKATGPTRATFKNPVAVVHDDPEVQALWFASRRAALRATYGPLFRALQLSSDQVARFQDVAIRREQQHLDLAASMWTQGLSNRDPALARLEEQVKAEYESAMSDLLGAAGFQHMRDYELSLPVRKISTAFAGVAAMRDLSLTPDQTEQLTKLLADTSWRYTRTGATDPQTIDWPAVDAQARSFLTEAQLRLFQSVEPEDGYNLYMFRFGSQVASLVNRAKRVAAGLPEVSAPAAKPPTN